MEIIMNTKPLYRYILTLIIIAGILFRLYWVFFHFTHYDDVGFINCLVRLSSEQKPFINFLEYGWTYAPLQVFFSKILVNPSFPYIFNIALGRFPSFLAGSASILLTYSLIKKSFSYSDFKKPILVIAVAIIASSWENIIYSAQAEPYEIGVLAVLALTIYFQGFCGGKAFSMPWLITLSVSAFYSQYHSVIILASLYFSMFVQANKKDKIRLVCSGVVSGLLSLPLICTFLDKGLLERGVNWNAGINGRFLFPFEYTNIHDLISVKTIKWFVDNAYTYLHVFFVSNQFNAWTKILTIILGAACLFGLVHIHRKNKWLALYLDLIALEFIGLVLMKKLTFSPSRHTLIFYPLVLLVLCYGIEWCLSLGKKRYTWLLAVWGFLMAGAYLQSTVTEIPLRHNLLLSGIAEEYIEKYQPKGIIAYYGFDPQLMDFPFYHRTGNPQLHMSAYVKEEPAKSRYVMVLGVGKAISQIGQARIAQIGEEFPDLAGDIFTDQESVMRYAVDCYEQDTHTEVEYGSRYFSNIPHGLYIYILDTGK